MSKPVGTVDTYVHAGALVGSITDDYGNVILSSDTDGNITGDALTEFIQYGVWNGSFSIGPPQAAISSNFNIDSSNNPMPYWTGPTSVSGGSITCTWVADSASPSGYNLRFNLAASQPGDGAYMEQIIPLGGHRVMGSIVNVRLDGTVVAISAGTTVFAGPRMQFLDASLNTLGSEVNGEGSYTVTGDFSTSTILPASSRYPTARFLRLRIAVERAVGTLAATVDISNVRIDRGQGSVLLYDETSASTYLPAQIYALAGNLKLAAGHTGISVLIDGANSTLDIQTLGSVRFPINQIASSDANTLDDYAEGTWTPTVNFVTNGNLNVVYSTQLGTYTKVGRLVTCTAQITTSTFTFTTASGNFRLGGLPFSVNGTTRAYGAIQASGWTLAAVSSLVVVPIVSGTNSNLIASRSGLASVQLDNTHFTTGTNVTMNYTVSYEV